MKSFAVLLLENQQLRDELAQANARNQLLKDRLDIALETLEDIKDSTRQCPYREFNCGVC